MISAQILGYDKILAKLNALGPKLQDETRKSVLKLCLLLSAKVKRDKLSGQVLKVKTGTLRRSITHRIIDTPQGVVGQVGTNLAYARVHEFGFKGSVSVKAHMREIKQAWGKPISPRSVSVKTFTRKVNIPERSFLRSALQEMQPDIREEMLKAIGRAIK